MDKKKTPLVIAIAGGTGSGKTTVSKKVLERVGIERVTYLQHDSYYKDLSDLPPLQRASINFDHPSSLETELMVKHLRELKRWNTVEVPIYDFKTHTRIKETQTTEPHPVIIVEGILLFSEPLLRSLFDIRLFVDTDADIRFIRRLERDINERGRTADSVIRQYLSTVRPMHLEFVEPSKRYADIIIPEGGFNTVALDMVSSRIESMLAK
jgi:uridine kinase